MSLNHGALQAANSVTNALLALNSAANFAIYCLVGNKFRRILRRRVLRCGRSTTTTDELTALPAGRESVAPATASAAAPNPRLDGASLPGEAPNPHLDGGSLPAEAPNPHLDGGSLPGEAPNPHLDGGSLPGEAPNPHLDGGSLPAEAPNPHLDGGSLPGADTTVTAVRCARKDDDADRRNEQRVVVVDVSAVDAAATACSSPTTP